MDRSDAEKGGSLYSVHPGVATMQEWVADLKDKTGRTLEDWIALVGKEGPPTEKERREWLKTKHKAPTVRGGSLSAPKEKEAKKAIPINIWKWRCNMLMSNMLARR